MLGRERDLDSENRGVCLGVDTLGVPSRVSYLQDLTFHTKEAVYDLLLAYSQEYGNIVGIKLLDTAKRVRTAHVPDPKTTRI